MTRTTDNPHHDPDLSGGIMSKQTINVAPTAETVVALYRQLDRSPDTTFLIASTAVEAGLGEVTIDRLSLRLVLDGEVLS